mgnify:CR=1 FL=1
MNLIYGATYITNGGAIVKSVGMQPDVNGNDRPHVLVVEDRITGGINLGVIYGVHLHTAISPWTPVRMLVPLGIEFNHEIVETL